MGLVGRLRKTYKVGAKISGKKAGEVYANMARHSIDPCFRGVIIAAHGWERSSAWYKDVYEGKRQGYFQMGSGWNSFGNMMTDLNHGLDFAVSFACGGGLDAGLEDSVSTDGYVVEEDGTVWFGPEGWTGDSAQDLGEEAHWAGWRARK